MNSSKFTQFYNSSQSEYSTIKLLKPKKLLVLDLDNTLCDFYINNYSRDRGMEVIRPHLHSFLTAAYRYYELVIWSATDQNSIDSKLIALNMVANSAYKILFTLNETSMINTKTLMGNAKVKALSVIWRRCSEYNQTNTLIVDDIPGNFYLNPRNGLHIKPYHKTEYKTDHELQLLTQYVVHIAKHCNHFENLNHRLWKEHVVASEIN